MVNSCTVSAQSSLFSALTASNTATLVVMKLNEQSPVTAITAGLQAVKLFDAAIAFGSQVKGSARADSDIDVAVLFHDNAARDTFNRTVLNVLGGLGQITGRDVHIVDIERASLELQHAIFRDGKVVFDRSGGELQNLQYRSSVQYIDGEYLRRMILRDQRRALERSLGRS